MMGYAIFAVALIALWVAYALERLRGIRLQCERDVARIERKHALEDARQSRADAKLDRDMLESSRAREELLLQTLEQHATKLEHDRKLLNSAISQKFLVADVWRN